MLLLKYDAQEVLVCEPKLKECCVKEKVPPEVNTGSGDCCYDIWATEFADYDKKYKSADEMVVYLMDRRTHLGTQKDMWKAWKDELDQVDTCSEKICRGLDVLLHHTLRVSKNQWLTKRAIKLLYCMLRDFYMQIDLLKKKYNYLINCIQCTANQTLVPGQGIMLLIEDYGKKLDAVIQTRSDLFDAVITVISISNTINKNIGHQGHHFGLQGILKEWKKVFNCDKKHGDEEEDRRRNEFTRESYQRKQPEGEFEDSGLEPMLKFPICESRYYKKIDGKYQEDNKDYNELSKWLLEETKNRDNLKELRDGLSAVINDEKVNPSKRC